MSKSFNYIFIDESGKPEMYSARGVNLVESGKATKFLVLAAVRCDDQLFIQQKITDFKSILLKDIELTKIFSSTYALDTFHAQTDYSEIREKFYNFINSLEVKIDVLVVEKLKCYETLKRNPGKLYGVMAGQLLKNICHNPHYKHGGLQVADYIAYAVFQVFERGNWKWYEIVKDKIGKIQDICNKKYYTRSNPLQLST